MSRTEYRGSLEDVVTAVLHVATNRARTAKPFGPEMAAKLLPEVEAQMRAGGVASVMTKDRAVAIVSSLGGVAHEGGSTRDYEWHTVRLDGEFTEQQLDALVFMMHSARDGRPIWPENGD